MIKAVKLVKVTKFTLLCNHQNMWMVKNI